MTFDFMLSRTVCPRAARVAGYWLVMALTSATFGAHGAVPRQNLSGHVPSAVSRLTAQADLPATNRLQLNLSLPLRNQTELTGLLQGLYDPASTNYHHFLKPSEFTDRFAPTAADYEAVAAFAQAHGLAVTRRHANRMLVEVSGSVADVQSALHTHLHVYRHPAEARTFYAPDTEPSLDLAVPVLHVGGLDNFTIPHPMSLPVAPQDGSAGGTGGAGAATNATSGGSGPGGSFFGDDFRSAYAPGVSLTGTGQSVALVQFDSGFYQSDITAYETAAGLTNVPITTVLLDGYNGGPGIANNEVSLDIEMAIAMAPGLAGVIVYEGTSPDDILNQIATDDAANQVSISWTYPTDATTAQIFQQLAAQGQSCFNSSGDADAYSGAIASPCDSPYLTVVGGTALTLGATGFYGGEAWDDYDSGSYWTGETVWNLGNGIGSGGGTSTVYTIPSWQTNARATNGGSATMRNLPDVAMVAHNVWVCYGNGSTGAFDGTSCATPLWAGFTALINQEAAAAGEAPAGFLNPALYQLGSQPAYNNYFHDITTGNNTSTNSPGHYYAGTGYDLCTGWGSPGGQTLIDALVNPNSLVITPSAGFVSVGGTNGPFSIVSQTFGLTNWASHSLHWSLTNTSQWLNVSASGGTLQAGAGTAVTVSLNNTASNLPAGTYGATLTFNLSANAGSVARTFYLEVVGPPTVTSSVNNVYVLAGMTATFQVGVTSGVPVKYQWQKYGVNLADGGRIAGSTSNVLTIANASTSDMGTYDVVVSNAVRAVTTSSAGLFVFITKPDIITSPTNLTVTAGGSAQLSVTAYGTTSLGYRWTCAGTTVAGATNAVLLFPNVQPANAGTYSVVVSNSYGTATSTGATLTVLTNPPCDAPPSGLVSWWGGEDNCVDLIGTNLGIPGAGLTYAAARVEDGFVMANTNAYVRIPASPSLNVGAGGGFTFEAWILPTNVTGLHPIAEWKSGANENASFGVQLWIGRRTTDQGVLCVTLVDTNNNNYAQVTTRSGVLAANVFQHVALTYSQTDGFVRLFVNGTNVAGSYWGTFNPATQYDLWLGAHPDLCGGGCASDATCLGGLMDEPSLYSRALATNEIAAIYQAGGSGKCEPLLPPYIDAAPADQAATVGGMATLNVQAGGTRPLGYQWSFNGTPLAGATAATLLLTNLQAGQAGHYSVTVSNVFGATNSSAAALQIYTVPAVPPFITAPLTNLTVAAGQTAGFWVAAGGTGPLGYQWSWNGAPITGCTNATLLLPNVSAAGAGTYAVVVTNQFGAATNSASLTVTSVTSALDHFGWSPVTGQQFVNVPFSVTFEAQDGGGNCFTAYAGDFSLTATNADGSTAPVSTVSGNWSAGAWTGSVVLSAPATNVVLVVSDSLGHTGVSSPLTVAAQPTLSAGVTGSSLLMQWPAAPAGFVLQTSPSLTSGQWTTVTDSPVQVGSQWQLPVSMSNASCFYRLIYVGN